MDRRPSTDIPPEARPAPLLLHAVGRGVPLPRSRVAGGVTGKQREDQIGGIIGISAFVAMILYLGASAPKSGTKWR
jgi:hypothetical protein